MRMPKEQKAYRQQSNSFGQIAGIAAAVLLLVFVGGVYVASRPSQGYVLQRETQKIVSAARLTIIRDVLFGGAVFCLLAAGVGAVVLGLHWGWFRSNTVRADGGVYPLIRERRRGETLFHDPNRQVAGATVYYREADGSLQARHLLGPGGIGSQMQATSQAQMTQLVAAVASGNGEFDKNKRETVKTALKASDRGRQVTMPDVIILDDDTVESPDRPLLTAMHQDWAEVE